MKKILLFLILFSSFVFSSTVELPVPVSSQMSYPCDTLKKTNYNEVNVNTSGSYRVEQNNNNNYVSVEVTNTQNLQSIFINGSTVQISNFVYPTDSYYSHRDTTTYTCEACNPEIDVCAVPSCAEGLVLNPETGECGVPTVPLCPVNTWVCGTECVCPEEAALHIASFTDLAGRYQMLIGCSSFHRAYCDMAAPEPPPLENLTCPTVYNGLALKAANITESRCAAFANEMFNYVAEYVQAEGIACCYSNSPSSGGCPPNTMSVSGGGCTPIPTRPDQNQTQQTNAPTINGGTVDMSTANEIGDTINNSVQNGNTPENTSLEAINGSLGTGAGFGAGRASQAVEGYVLLNLPIHASSAGCSGSLRKTFNLMGQPFTLDATQAVTGIEQNSPMIKSIVIFLAAIGGIVTVMSGIRS